MGLSEDELAFYDALAQSKNAVEVLGDEKLHSIARDLVKSVRESATIDWSLRESVRAGIRLKIKKLLKRHGYPPDATERATDQVLEQAELLSQAAQGRPSAPVSYPGFLAPTLFLARTNRGKIRLRRK